MKVIWYDEDGGKDDVGDNDEVGNNEIRPPKRMSQ